MLADFVLGQGALQGISILIALYLVRTLSISDYAKYGLAIGFQFTTTVLMDLGYTSTIIPLVGDRVGDRALVGRYVRAAKVHRDRTFWAMAPVAGVLFLYITHRQHWNWPVQIALLASILLALYSSGPVAYFGAPLILYRRLRAFYVPQSLTNCCRLLAYSLLRLAGSLNAWVAAALGAVNITLNGFLLKRKSLESIEWPEAPDPIIQAEVQRYIVPAIPALILGAFHGQIALFLMGIFGSTVDLAQVAALTRLGQIFNLMMTFNVVIVEPYVARLRRDHLPRTYFLLLVLALLGCTALTVLSFAAPGIFLWPLGKQYASLRNLIGWVVMTACINYIAGLIWIMNRSRKWIFWRGSIAEIGLVVMVQLVFAAIFGVQNTWHAVMFNFVTSLAYVAAHTYIAQYGFRKGARDGALNREAPEVSLS